MDKTLITLNKFVSQTKARYPYELSNKSLKQLLPSSDQKSYSSGKPEARNTQLETRVRYC